MVRAVFLFIPFALALAMPGALAADASAQARGFIRGGNSMSMSRVVSPTVVASWMSHENHADSTATTLLVLWRGTPGWFSKGTGGSSGSSGGSSGGSRGANPNGSYGFQSLSEGGLTFRIEFDYDSRIATLVNQEISLKAINVVLVDFVDSANGPMIVASRWVDPVPSAPPPVDPVASIVKRTPELFEYLRCDLSLPDPVMKVMMPIICGQMRP